MNRNRNDEFYEKQVAQWREEGWSWEDIEVAHKREDALQAQLTAWCEAGHPRIVTGTWKEIVKRCREDEGSPQAGVPDFAAAVQKADPKIRRLMRRLGIRGWGGARNLDRKTVLAVPGYSEGRWAEFQDWLGEYGVERAVPALGEWGGDRVPAEGAKAASMADFKSWNDYMWSVLGDILRHSRLTGERLERVRAILELRTGLFSEGRRLSMREIGQQLKVSRQRVDQMEKNFIYGTKNKRFGGLPGYTWKFGDVLARVEKAFGGAYVLTMEEFRKRLAAEIPWEEECTLRVIRLLLVLGRLDRRTGPRSQSRATAWGESADGELLAEGYVTRDFEERGKARYEAFVADLAERGGSGRGPKAYEAAKKRLAKRGVPELTETEYGFFEEKAEEDHGARVGKVSAATERAARVRQAFLKVLRPAGFHGMTLDEIQNGLNEEFGEDAPNAKTFVIRRLPAELDDRGTQIWLVHQGGGIGNVSRYALSTFCPKLDADRVRVLETEMEKHLRRTPCTAALVRRFEKDWKARGLLPEGLEQRGLYWALKTSSTGLVDYPLTKSPAYSLPGSTVPEFGLLKFQATMYFKGRRTVSQEELFRFAEEVFGLAHNTLQSECQREFAREGDRFVVNEGLPE